MSWSLSNIKMIKAAYLKKMKGNNGNCQKLKPDPIFIKKKGTIEEKCISIRMKFCNRHYAFISVSMLLTKFIGFWFLE
jgi:hypothetical protein